MNDLTAAERAQTERDLVTLKAGLARVNVASQPEGAIIRDTRFPARGESVTNSYGPLQGKVELGLLRQREGDAVRRSDGGGAASHELREPCYERRWTKDPYRVLIVSGRSVP